MFRWFSQLLNRIIKLLGFHRKKPVPLAPDSPQTSSTIPTVAPELALAAAEPPVYQKRDSIFTYREKAFYSALLDAVLREYWIFAKVRMGDVVFLANEPENRKFHNNQIFCKHVDFVLCEKRTYKPLLAIELDDSSHLHIDKRARDQLKNRIFSQAGLPLLRVPIQQHYVVETLKEQIVSNIQGTSQNPT